MIKVAFVINYITNNGPSNVVLDIIHNLERPRYEISLITFFTCNDSKIVERLKKEQVHVYECHTLTRSKCLLGQDREFQVIIAEGKFDIIHTHGFIPDILSSRLQTTTKRVTTLHNNMFEDYVQSYGRLKGRVYILLHIAALKKLDQCVCCAKSVYMVMRHYLKNTMYVRNGIKPKMAQHEISRDQVDIPDDSTVFVFSGGLFFRKNVQFMAQYFMQYHDEKEYLIVLGDGPKREACEKAADDHVRFMGFQNDPAAFYNISDVYISASRSEGFSISVLEALSCGLGLFLSDIPSHKEVLSIGKNLYLGESFSIKDNGESFGTVLSTLRKNYGRIDKESIKQFQQEKLSDKAMTEKYDKVYRNMVSTNS